MDEREQRELLEDLLEVVEPMRRALSLVIETLREELDELPTRQGSVWDRLADRCERSRALRERLDETPRRPPELEVLLADHKRAIDSLAEATPKPPPELRLID